jgi:Protein of unknown function (DUF3052)
VSATARQAQDERGQAERLGIKPGQVVQELGYDTDCDEQLRQAITAVEGVELVDEDYEDVVDVVLMWFREDDGDLVDALVDALAPLGDGGYIWLLTPKSGRPGHVEPSDIGEAAPTAGLAQTSSVSAARDWSGSRLVAPKARRLSPRGRPPPARLSAKTAVLPGAPASAATRNLPPRARSRGPRSSPARRHPARGHPARGHPARGRLVKSPATMIQNGCGCLWSRPAGPLGLAGVGAG